MFGYVRPDKGELLVRDYEFYRATYCGICRAMKKTTGPLSPAFLSYDSVYLALVRMLYLPDEAFAARPIRCIAHPLRKRSALLPNEAILYTARVFSCLTYHRVRDDVADEAFVRRTAEGALLPVLRHGARRASLSELESMMRRELSAIRGMEDAGCTSVDLPAERFGVLLGETFAYGLADAARTLTYEIGYHLGKFIYVADAAEDYEKDRRRGAYNPFVLRYGTDRMTHDNRMTVHTALLLEAQQIGRAVELLPFGTRGTLERLIKNVTYRGLVERIRFLLEEESV